MCKQRLPPSAVHSPAVKGSVELCVPRTAAETEGAAEDNLSKVNSSLHQFLRLEWAARSPSSTDELLSTPTLSNGVLKAGVHLRQCCGVFREGHLGHRTDAAGPHAHPGCVADSTQGAAHLRPPSSIPCGLRSPCPSPACSRLPAERLEACCLIAVARVKARN